MIDPVTHRTMSECSYHGTKHLTGTEALRSWSGVREKHILYIAGTWEKWGALPEQELFVLVLLLLVIIVEFLFLVSVVALHLLTEDFKPQSGTHFEKCKKKKDIYRIIQQSKQMLWLTLWVCFQGSFQPVLHNWCTKGRGMCYPVCGMMHIKEPLLLIGKSSPCGGNRFPLLLSEWSLTICLTPYNRK